RPRRGAAEPEVVEESAKESDEQGQVLPPLTVGQRLGITGMEVVEKETQPPRRYTDATLLTAMKNAGRQLEDEALAEAMKQTGLGTSATRAEIIERLIRSELVERQRKALAPTEKGMALIAVAAEPLRSPELTASWEQRLKDVEEGRLDAGAFYDEIVRFVRELVPQVATGPVMDAALRSAARPSKRRSRRVGDDAGASPSTDGPLGPCPKCRQGQVIEGRKGYGCNRYREGCTFVVWKEIAGKRLAVTQVRELLEHGRTGPIAGFRSRAGRRFAASLKLDPEMKVVFDFSEPRPPASRRRKTTPRGARSSPS
ncbi:MAG: DNA topoisomerase, partial [Candidatus Latescibacterota bacterium]